ncbi:MAG: cytosolic protein [Nanoarchaeota archaeon]|nr:cytosolic protein [Nanoarchaeota archaeon]
MGWQNKQIEKCPCTYPGCPNKNNCPECFRSHIQNQELPACFFPPEVEKTFDRSIKRFLSLKK